MTTAESKRFDVAEIPPATLQEKILGLVARTDPADQMACAVMLVATADLRPREVLALTWEDIDLRNGTAKVDKELAPTGVPGPCKTPRTVEIPGRVCRDLVILRRSQGARLGRHWHSLTEEIEGMVVAESHTPLVCNLRGGYIKPNKLTRWWSYRRFDLYMGGWTFTDLRKARMILDKTGIGLGW